MNRRLYSILRKIIDGKYKNISECASTYSVSEQTIRKDIRKINVLLKEKNQPDIQVNDAGDIYIDEKIGIEEKAVKEIAQESNYYTYKLSQNERRTILAMVLLNTDKYTTISTISEILYVSKNTLLSDLDDLKTWFDENNMKLVSQTRKGYMVVGTEENIRRGILKLLILNSDIFEADNYENDIFQTLLIQEFDKNDLISQIETILKDAEEKFDVHLTDFSYREVIYQLLIVVNRLLENKFLTDMPADDGKRLRKSSKYAMGKWIMERLGEEFDLWVYPQEIVSIVEALRSKSYIKNNGRSIDMIDIQILINEFIYKISDSLEINYYLDFYLYDLLIDHMRTAVHRLRQKHSLVNPLMPQLEAMYPTVFKEVKEHIAALEKYIGHEFSKDEISFIVMYIVSIMEKNKSRDVIVNTILVCNTGRGTAQMIATRLQTLSRQIKIVDIMSSHNQKVIREKKPDMIISTVPLKSGDIPVIQVNPIMTDEDLYKIQSLAIKLQDRKQKQMKKANMNIELPPVEQQATKESLFSSHYSFIDILSEDRIKLNVKASDWREAVRIAGQILCDKGIITKRYVKAMLENIEDNGPYVVIYPGIAIPHATPAEGAKKMAAALVRLEKPVRFHHDQNDPVTFVIALSVVDSDSIDRPLYNLTRMLGTGTFVQDINKAETAKELMHIINHYEETIRRDDSL